MSAPVRGAGDGEHRCPAVLREVIRHPALELVGVRVYDPEKVGARRRRAGRGARHHGWVPATDASRRRSRVPQPTACSTCRVMSLSSTKSSRGSTGGTNVVTTRGEFFDRGGRLPDDPPAGGNAVRTACERGRVSIYSTGSSPGFVTDALPFLVLLSLERHVDRGRDRRVRRTCRSASPAPPLRADGVRPADRTTVIRVPAVYLLEEFLDVAACARRSCGSHPSTSGRSAGELAAARQTPIAIPGRGRSPPGTVAAQRTVLHRGCTTGVAVVRFPRELVLHDRPRSCVGSASDRLARLQVHGDAALDVHVGFPVPVEQLGAFTPALTANWPVNVVRRCARPRPGSCPPPTSRRSRPARSGLAGDRAPGVSQLGLQPVLDVARAAPLRDRGLGREQVKPGTPPDRRAARWVRPPGSAGCVYSTSSSWNPSTAPTDTRVGGRPDTRGAGRRGGGGNVAAVRRAHRGTTSSRTSWTRGSTPEPVLLARRRALAVVEHRRIEELERHRHFARSRQPASAAASPPPALTPMSPIRCRVDAQLVGVVAVSSRIPPSQSSSGPGIGRLRRQPVLDRHADQAERWAPAPRRCGRPSCRCRARSRRRASSTRTANAARRPAGRCTRSGTPGSPRTTWSARSTAPDRGGATAVMLRKRARTSAVRSPNGTTADHVGDVGIEEVPGVHGRPPTIPRRTGSDRFRGSASRACGLRHSTQDLREQAVQHVPVRPLGDDLPGRRLEVVLAHRPRGALHLRLEPAVPPRFEARPDLDRGDALAHHALHRPDRVLRLALEHR